MNALAGKIEELIKIAFDGGYDEADYYRWTERVTQFLSKAFNSETAFAFDSIANEDWTHRRAAQVGMLEGLVQRLLRDPAESPSGSASLPQVAPETLLSKKVFVVHGHDNEAKETVARFIERLGLEAVILHEHPNSGNTLIEKFEIFADVGFAVVLLTPDDYGGPADLATVKKRARQNVVFELGYFVGKLKRSRVCALYKPDVEIPSDFQGVVYVELDEKGAWRMKLAKELAAARMPIDLEALLKS